MSTYRIALDHGGGVTSSVDLDEDSLAHMTAMLLGERMQASIGEGDEAD